MATRTYFPDVAQVSIGPRISKVFDFISYGFAVFCGYIVLGGIWAGEATILTNTHPIAPTTIFFVLILLVGSLEGLQISVASLWRKDLDELQARYPRGYKLHQNFKMEESATQNFFAGRQLFIVALVFLAARLTSFPNMTDWPFIAQPFPDFLTPWFSVIFLELGLLGAIFTYWLGNLMPQLVATDYPLFFLNIPGMKHLYGACIAINSVNLPEPSKWLAGFSTRNWEEEEDIPISSQQKYDRELEIDSGYAIQDIRLEWLFKKNETGVTYEVTYEVGRDGVSEIIDEKLVFPYDAGVVKIEAYVADLVREDGEEYDIEFDRTIQTTSQGDMHFYAIMDPRGSFNEGDVIKLKVEAIAEERPPEYDRHRVRVDHATEKLTFLMRFDEEYSFNEPEITRIHPIGDETVKMDVDKNEIQSDETFTFPREGTVFEINWNGYLSMDERGDVQTNI